MDKQGMIENIYRVLHGADFEHWYATKFDDHVAGERGARSEEQIKRDIAKLFHLEAA